MQVDSMHTGWEALERSHDHDPLRHIAQDERAEVLAGGILHVGLDVAAIRLGGRRLRGGGSTAIRLGAVRLRGAGGESNETYQQSRRTHGMSGLVVPNN